MNSSLFVRAAEDHSSRVFMRFPLQARIVLSTLLVSISWVHAETHPSKDSREAAITEDIVEVNIDGNKLAKLFERFSGHKVVVTPEAASATFHFVQAASKCDPIKYSEAQELVRTSAIIENFRFVQEPTDSKTFILQPAKPPYPLGNAPIVIYNSSTPLPGDDKVISYVMELKNIASEDALHRLKSATEKGRDYGALACFPRSNAIVITDTVSNVKRLIEMQKVFDQPSNQSSLQTSLSEVATPETTASQVDSRQDVDAKTGK
jgi:type II secretory pathway component GspD/PulD (secretin)